MGYAVYNVDEVLERLNNYINTHDDPTIPEFCSDFINPCRDTLHEWSKTNKLVSDAIKRLQTKQESFLIKAKDINPIMAIFRLKQPQHGYKDKQEIDSNINHTFTIDITDEDTDNNEDS